MTKASDIVKVAVSQIGVKESPANSNKTKYGKWFGMNGVPWCAIFLDWCFEHAKGGSLFPHIHLPPTHRMKSYRPARARGS